MNSSQAKLDLLFLTEASKLLGIKPPSIEYVRDFKLIGQCVEAGSKVKLCENWEITLPLGVICRYIVIAHELIHAKQHQSGDYVDRWDGTVFKGQFVSNKQYSDMNHEDVPWEIEANDQMESLRDSTIEILRSKGIEIEKIEFVKNKSSQEPPKHSTENKYDKTMKLIKKRNEEASLKDVPVIEKTIMDFDTCESCGCSLDWINFSSYCSGCESELSDEHEPLERDEDLFWDEGA